MAGGTETKSCIGCGAIIERAPDVTELRWSERRYCNRGCGNRSGQKPPSINVGGRATADGFRAATEHSSAALLRRLIRYGLKHGLPNHTAEMVREKAEELGVAA